MGTDNFVSQGSVTLNYQATSMEMVSFLQQVLQEWGEQAELTQKLKDRLDCSEIQNDFLDTTRFLNGLKNLERACSQLSDGFLNGVSLKIGGGNGFSYRSITLRHSDTPEEMALHLKKVMQAREERETRIKNLQSRLGCTIVKDSELALESYLQGLQSLERSCSQLGDGFLDGVFLCINKENMVSWHPMTLKCHITLDCGATSEEMVSFLQQATQKNQERAMLIQEQETLVKTLQNNFPSLNITISDDIDYESSLQGLRTLQKVLSSSLKDFINPIALRIGKENKFLDPIKLDYRATFECMDLHIRESIQKKREMEEYIAKIKKNFPSLNLRISNLIDYGSSLQGLQNLETACSLMLPHGPASVIPDGFLNGIRLCVGSANERYGNNEINFDYRSSPEDLAKFLFQVVNKLRHESRS